MDPLSKSSIRLLFLAIGLIATTNAESPVYILAENSVQYMTSSTLKWVPAGIGNKISLQNAEVGAYKIVQDDSTDDNAATSATSVPIYVCRARQNGVWISGQLRPDEDKCIVSMHGKVHQADRYEVLINIENSARLSWVRKDKFNVIPQGSVAGGHETYDNFIARIEVPNRDHERHNTFSHYLGKLDPSDNLGKYSLVDENNKEVDVEGGDVLVETEPIRYDLKHIKFDPYRSRLNREPRILGHAVLKNENEDGGVQRVDTVISYKYTYILNWGHGKGMLVGLPFSVHLKNNGTAGAKTDEHWGWGIAEKKEKVELPPIEQYLEPGTAVNVTLKGEYVDADSQYTATVVAVYKDGETKERIIKENKREAGMRNVIPEFGPVYFLHNNSYVPTTTTTTTTTTSTTTTTTTTRTTTEEVVPITSPDVEDTPMAKKKKAEDQATAGKHENSSSMMADGDALSLSKDEDVNNAIRAKTAAGGAAKLGGLSRGMGVAAFMVMVLLNQLT